MRALRSAGLALLLCVVALAALFASPTRARAVEYNLSGSAQLDYHYVLPAGPTDPRPPTHTIDGFTEELSIKLAVDVTAHLSANVKVCWGCHGFELGMGFVDYRVADELNIRAGRFIPTFGEFQLRHDVANHRTSDRPLPYDMGRMLYLFQFNRSVLPLPYVETGIELSGQHFFGNRVQLDYAAHVVAGLRSNAPNATDVDFIASRSAVPYYVDNNSAPSAGGRLGFTFRLGERTDLTLGGSAIYGPYDASSRLSYFILGADAFLRAGRTNLRAEYLIRRTEMDSSSPGRFLYDLPANNPDGSPMLPLFNAKDGWYVELEQPINRRLELVFRWDGLHRAGNVLNGSELQSDAGISRLTAGANIIIERGYRFKVNVEHWLFWGFRENQGPSVFVFGVPQALSAHVSAVAVF